MKRVSQGGNSPASKFHFLCEDDSDPSSQEITFSHCSNSTPSESLGFGVNQRASQDSSKPPLSQNLYDGHLLDVSSDSSNPTFEPHSDVGSDPEIDRGSDVLDNTQLTLDTFYGLLLQINFCHV